jgi:hypothetical protein
LESDGIICHSFWRGDNVEKYDGLIFTYYSEEQLRTSVEEYFDIIQVQKYQEMEVNDSLLIIARKK